MIEEVLAPAPQSTSSGPTTTVKSGDCSARGGLGAVPNTAVGRLANVDVGEYRAALASGIKARLTLSNILRIAAGVSLANTWEVILRYELPRLIHTFPDKPLNENQSLFVTIFVLRGTLLWLLSSRLSQDFVDKVWIPGVQALKKRVLRS